MPKSKDKDIPVDYLLACFAYDPATGAIKWSRRPPEHFSNARQWKRWTTRHTNKPSGSRQSQGYLNVVLTFCGKKKKLKAHRVAWALARGSWAHNEEPYHLNGVRSDNRLENLSETNPNRTAERAPRPPAKRLSEAKLAALAKAHAARRANAAALRASKAEHNLLIRGDPPAPEGPRVGVFSEIGELDGTPGARGHETNGRGI